MTVTVVIPALDEEESIGQVLAEIPSSVVDEVIVRVAGPDESWLGEPAVEVNCHGGAAAVQATLDAIVAAGAERVRWQDIGVRAFGNRRIDAVQLEAWWRLPGAKTALASDMLLAQWHGALSDAARQALAGDPDRGALAKLLDTARLGIALCCRHISKLI